MFMNRSDMKCQCQKQSGNNFNKIFVNALWGVFSAPRKVYEFHSSIGGSWNTIYLFHFDKQNFRL